MKYLPGHLENLSTWIDLAAEVVVVDSFSADGTLDYLKKNLRHPQIKFLEHPPGLYASWNYGIGQISSEFCYLSTIGDSITRAGLEHLVATASRLHCDVLVSRPDFVDESGKPCVGPEWPMDDVIRRLNLNEPIRLPAAIVIATALAHTGGAITGSCASDLFRTTALKKNPFPLDFGVAGDGAWSLQNAGRVNWAVTPEKMTLFRRHPTVASAAEVNAGGIADQFAPLARKMVSEWLESNSSEVPFGAREEIARLLEISIKYDESRRKYNFLRKGNWPWILNPTAWLARSQRNQIKTRIHSLSQSIYDYCSKTKNNSEQKVDFGHPAKIAAQ